MSVIANALTTVVKVKLHLGISVATYDSLFEQLIDEATLFIETYCNRVISKTTHTDVLFDGDDYDSTLYIKNFPITEIDTIEYNNGTFATPDWTAYTTDQYEYNLAEGIIYFDVDLPSGKQNVRITYTGGFTTVPQDIEMACNKLVARYYNKRKSEGVSAETAGITNLTWDDVLTKEITSVLNRYKNHTI